MKRKIINTADGSHTIRIEEWNEQYHSVHGAVAESYHVFIENGLQQVKLKEISVLEMGFGTGLNALITLKEARESKLKINYTAVEAFPVHSDEWTQLNYPDVLSADFLENTFQKIHKAEWEKWVSISPEFQINKRQMDMRDFKGNKAYDLIYYDAFGFRVQPELWSEAIFSNMYRALKDEGILVTYSAKGSVRRSLQQVGFMVERLPGPPGKREMLRAIKFSATAS